MAAGGAATSGVGSGISWQISIGSGEVSTSRDAAGFEGGEFFSDSIQHLEQQFAVASLPKKPQPILQSMGGLGVCCSDMLQ